MSLPANRILARARAGETALGMYVKTAAPEAVAVAGAAGLDFVRVDAYHGSMGPETTAGLLRAAYAAGVTPAVRLPKEPFAIMSALENGAQQVTFPAVNFAAEAARLASWCRLPPRGEREASRPLFTLGASAAEYRRWAEEELLVSVQVESATGLANLAEIVAVEGVDMIQCGRADLALSLGIRGGFTDPRVLEAEARVVETALAAGKLVSMHFPPGAGMVESARAWLARGIACLTIGGDTQLLDAAVRERLDAIRATTP